MGQVSHEVAHELESFIVNEAKLADESHYQQWEDLWADDAVYWVPVKEGDDPAQKISLLYDNRTRIATRIRQLKTGYRYSQLPVSGMRRVISNFEYIEQADGRFQVEANFFLPEFSAQSVREFRIWSGRITYILSRRGEGFQMHMKKIVLVNGSEPIPTLSFLI
ncbi:MAG: aromatic-ring-hydroxylating dioxygenase subunit alpha [Piscirickettsiaceae bacterium]|nr:MAG: aromatic-ring-hydroxylating dioxygenase subunit alpha [Piscirickettsiaceae bacterium]